MDTMAEWQWKRWDAVARLGVVKLTMRERHSGGCADESYAMVAIWPGDGITGQALIR